MGSRTAALICLFVTAFWCADARAYTIVAEGNPADWGLSAGRLPLNENTGHIARGTGSGNNHVGEYVWRDAVGDERTEFSSPDGLVDLRSFHVTSDATRLYFLASFNGEPGVGNNSTQVQIAIDRDLVSGSGQTSLAQNCDTSVSDEAAWEYLVVTRMGSRTGTPFVYSETFADQNTGSAIDAISPTPNIDRAIEISVPWSMIGGVPDAPLRFTVVTLRSSPQDEARDILGGSDVLDAVTVNGHPSASANTSAEVADGVVDYAFDVWFHLDPHTEPKAPVLISEVLPRGDAGAWAEVFNASGGDIDIGGFRIGDQADVTGSGAGMVLFPSAAPLFAGHAAVVAGEADDYFAANGFNPSFEVADLDPLVPDMVDDAQWGDADPAPAAAGGQVLLLDRAFTVLDAVAWGTGAYPSLTAAPAPAAGRSLARSGVWRDSDDCADDLVALAAPTPRQLAGPCSDAFGNTLAATTPCSVGDPCSTDSCNDSGTCVAGVVIACSDDGNECTDDSCDEIYVLGCHRPESAGTSCTDTDADDCKAAQCDGLGVCDPVYGDEPAGTVCPDADPDDCRVAQCDGNGVCDPIRGNEPAGTDCPDTTPTDCTLAQCDGAGACDQARLAIGSGEPCPDTTPDDCYLAACDGTGTCDQQVSMRDTSYECRPSAGDCDPPESCDGASVVCPADQKSSGECRASRGQCDPAETCDGVSDDCPADLKSSDLCRPSGGDCDPAELCDGSGDHCPPDLKRTDECRGSNGQCDPAEQCDGVSNDCPADLKSSGQCRASGGVCDQAELCDGVSDDCPPDLKLRIECRSSMGPCDVAEACDGVSNACPADLKSTALCRTASGTCDVAEFCDGLSDACPADMMAPVFTPCADGDPCTEKTQCNGAGVCTGGLSICGGGLRRDGGAVVDAGSAVDAAGVDRVRPDAGSGDAAQAGSDTDGLAPPIDSAPTIGCAGCSAGPRSGALPGALAVGLLLLHRSRWRRRS